MNLHRRVTTLERQFGRRGPCRNCRGAGWPAVILVTDEEPDPEPRACPVCGQVSVVKRIVLTDDPDDERSECV